MQSSLTFTVTPSHSRLEALGSTPWITRLRMTKSRPFLLTEGAGEAAPKRGGSSDGSSRAQRPAPPNHLAGAFGPTPSNEGSLTPAPSMK